MYLQILKKRRLLPYITQTILLLRFVFLSSAQCPTIIFQIHCYQRVPVCKNRDHNVPIFFGTIIVKRVNYYAHKQLSNSRYVCISHLFVGNYIFVSNLTSLGINLERFPIVRVIFCTYFCCQNV